VLGVKPAFKDVDAGSFLAFLLSLVENQIEPNKDQRGTAPDQPLVRVDLKRPWWQTGKTVNLICD
jgi:hypothetical protein